VKAHGTGSRIISRWNTSAWAC